MDKFETILADIRRVNELELRNLEQKILKFNEEFGECNAEIVKLLGYTYKQYDKEHLVEEMADALQCLISVYADLEKRTGISIENDVLPAILVKNKKWEAKIKEYTIKNKN